MENRPESLKERKYLGAVELANEAANLTGRLVPRQERGSVNEVPDERMVRYYSTEGLIAPPEGKQGTSAVYGYLHLLQLLAVKRLQADHLSIKTIKELVEGKSVTELERLVGIGSAGEAVMESVNPAMEYLESLVRSSRPEAPEARAQTPAARKAPAPAGLKATWKRIEIEPGFELHIREDFMLSDDSRDRQRLARRILSEIEVHSREAGK